MHPCTYDAARQIQSTQTTNQSAAPVPRLRTILSAKTAAIACSALYQAIVASKCSADTGLDAEGTRLPKGLQRASLSPGPTSKEIRWQTNRH
jgi:hypothetical protein